MILWVSKISKKESKHFKKGVLFIRLEKSPSKSNNDRLWLRKLRISKGYTQEEIAKQCRITRPFYSQIELGTKNPSTNNAKKIATLLGFHWTIFFEKIEET